MSARSTRQEARVRILSPFTARLDRVILEDDGVPLKVKGATSADFEDQVDTLAQTAMLVVLEERASLEPTGGSLRRISTAPGFNPACPAFSTERWVAIMTADRGSALMNRNPWIYR